MDFGCPKRRARKADFARRFSRFESSAHRDEDFASVFQKHMLYCVHPAHKRDASRSSRVSVRDAVDAAVSQDVRHTAFGQVVWSRSPDAGIKLIEMIDQRRRLASPVLRGEHEAADKPSRRECRIVRLLL
jgi:hypothetical protein